MPPETALAWAQSRNTAHARHLRIYVFTLLSFLFLTHPLQSVISPIVTLAPLLQERGIFGLFRKQTVLGGELSLEQHKLFGSNTIPSTLSGKRIEFLAERFFSFSKSSLK